MKKLLLAYLILISAPLTLGRQFEDPDLTRVHNTYAISGSTFDVIVSKDLDLSLHSVCLHIGDKKASVPAEEMKNIGWPHLDKVIVSKEITHPSTHSRRRAPGQGCMAFDVL